MPVNVFKNHSRAIVERRFAALTALSVLLLWMEIPAPPCVLRFLTLPNESWDDFVIDYHRAHAASYDPRSLHTGTDYPRCMMFAVRVVLPSVAPLVQIT